jgi:branched-chain amino acid transport system substrate-binding protein
MTTDSDGPVFRGGPAFRGVSRRSLLRAGAAGIGAGLLPAAPFAAMAADQPPLGTWPAGSQGDSVFIGITVPLTGTYAAAGDDERKGYELAIEHLNTGHELMHRMSPKITKGVLGKQIKFGVADEQANANQAVQAQTRFISENKAVVTTGSVSSATAVACNHNAQRQHVIYLPGISGSNDTTGKDCVRYSFRACHYAYTAAHAIGPVLVKALGANRKAAYLTHDYTYGHSVYESMKEVTEKAGWKTVTNQLSPLGAPDFSSYLLNIANSGADVLIDIGFGDDAVISVKQAKQFGILDRMTLVMPYLSPFFAKQVGEDLVAGVYGTTEFWWTLEDKNELAKMFVAEFQKKYGYRPEWGAHTAYMQLALWVDSCERAGSFYPPDVIKAYESGQHLNTTLGEVWWRAQDHQLVRPVIVVRGKKKADMRNPEDFYDIVEVVPGEGVMQPADAFGCKLGDSV